MPAFKDLSRQKFGRLTAVRRAPNGACGETRWHCVCDDGNETIVSSSSLKSGGTASCGCWNREQSGKRLAQQATKHGHKRGGKSSSEYESYQGMKKRVLNPKYRMFKNYGGRGIKICDRWLYGEGGKSGFECFLEDMGPKPSPRLSIERKDNDGIYEPMNCYWGTARRQGNNKRNNRPITAFGVTHNLSIWARMTGIHQSTLWRRLEKMPPEQALATIKLQPGVMHEVVFVPASETNSATDTWEFKPYPDGAGAIRNYRRALFKDVWNAMDAAPARRTGMTIAAMRRPAPPKDR